MHPSSSEKGNHFFLIIVITSMIQMSFIRRKNTNYTLSSRTYLKKIPGKLLFIDLVKIFIFSEEDVAEMENS